VWLTIAITVDAVVSKVLGAGLGTHLGGFDNLDSLRPGIGMIWRGEVGLIVATVLVQNGFLAPEVLTPSVMMVLTTTLVSPPLLHLAFRSTGTVRPSAGKSGSPAVIEE
jgi:Kef-type K+ transport system membrane component KefB